MRSTQLEVENRLLRSEIAELKDQLRATKANVETGLRSPKELALTWLCHEYNVFYRRTGNILPNYIERLKAIEQLDDAHGK